MNIKYEFIECKECSSKPGSPILCDSCLHNRSVISNLSVALSKMIKLNLLKYEIESNEYISIDVLKEVGIDLGSVINSQIYTTSKYNNDRFEEGV